MNIWMDMVEEFPAFVQVTTALISDLVEDVEIRESLFSAIQLYIAERYLDNK